MSEIDGLHLRGGATREGIATGGPSLVAQRAATEGRGALERLSRNADDADALRALESSLGALEDAVREAPGLAPRHEALIRELREALRSHLAPEVPSTRPSAPPSRSAARTALRNGHPQRAARLWLGGRDTTALRRLDVSPRQLERDLRRAGFRSDEISSMREALDAEIGRRFQALVRDDGRRVVESLERRLERATRGDGDAVRRFEDQLFSAEGPALIERLRMAGAEDEARALDSAAMRGDRAAARPHLRRALHAMYDVVRDQAERIRRGDEGLADAWGSAYRAFETSVVRVARRLGMHLDPSAALKDASVLERAVQRSVVETRDRHERAVEAGRAFFDLAMDVTGLGFSDARAVLERRFATADAERRAVSGNGTLATAREAAAGEVVDTARMIGSAALSSVVEGLLEEACAALGITTQVETRLEELGDWVWERLQGLPVRTPDRETVQALVRRAVEKMLGEARGQAQRDVERAIERAATPQRPQDS